VHSGPASGAAGVSGSVPVCGEGAGARVRGEATYSRAEGCVGRRRETTPSLNQQLPGATVRRIAAALVLTRSAGSSARHYGVFEDLFSNSEAFRLIVG